MPIEIKELVIRAVVGGKEKTGTQARMSESEKEKLKNEITKAVTEKVMRLIQQKNER